MKRLFLVFLLTPLFFVACKSKTATKDPNADQINDTAHVVHPVEDTNTKIHSDQHAMLTQLTGNILSAIKSENYTVLAEYIDPETGLRFSPYGFVDTAHDMVFSKQEFLAKAANPKQGKILWGEMDGSGDPIKMTLNEYMKRFVYDADFANPEKVRINEIIKHGNLMNNLQSIYKDCHFTESHFSGFDEKYDGLDWRSLRLVFRFRHGGYYLAGIVHDEWTI